MEKLFKIKPNYPTRMITAFLKQPLAVFTISLLTNGTLITLDNHKISYTHYQNGHKKIVVLVHGFYTSKEDILLQKLKDELLKNYDVFMFDFRGHGKSSGFFTWTANEDKDFKTVLDYLAGKYKKVGIIAFSLGTSVCIKVLSENAKADSLICVSAPSEFSKIDYQFWKMSFKDDLFYTLIDRNGRKGKGVRPGAFWLKKPRPIEMVEKLKLPVLYIHGDKDWVIRAWHSEALYKKTISPKRLVILKGAPHAEYIMKTHKKDFINEIKEWFNLTLIETAPLFDSDKKDDYI